MTVTVDFMGPVLRPSGLTEVPMDISLPVGATVEQMLLQMGYQSAHVRHLGVFRDGLRLPVSAAMLDGETVTISVPFGGG